MAGKLGLMFEPSAQTGRIPLVLVVGESVSVTRAFLNNVLTHPMFVDSVVMGTRPDESVSVEPLRHPRVMTLPRLEPSLQSAAQENCLCCGMHSALGDALRSLFFEALRDREIGVERVLIESDTIETAQLTHTLRHTPFLGQRYFHQHTFRVSDPVDDAKNLLEILNAR